MRNSTRSSSSYDQIVPSVDELRTVYADKHVGDRFKFGRYPQGADGEMMPITWRVLDREKDHILVMAEQGLDCRPYEEVQSVTWAGSTIRRWLNSRFYDKAFDEQERDLILQTRLENDTGPDTEDRVFLLDKDEIKSSIKHERLRDIVYFARPTEYAVGKGVFVDDENGCCGWWLRSSVRPDVYKAVKATNMCINCINNDGSEVDTGYLAVRPAIRIARFARFSSPGHKVKSAIARGADTFLPSTHTVQVGDSLEFGHYPQGANGEVRPITWRVLQCEEDYLLVMAEQGLDCKPYEESQRVTWANSNMRRWLNYVFYDKAFSEQECNCILKTTVINDAGPETRDRIFLLSADEAESLFANDMARRATPTMYAKSKGIDTFDNYHGCCSWWLRSHGDYDDSAANVSAYGEINGIFGFSSDNIAVRPALKLAI